MLLCGEEFFGSSFGNAVLNRKYCFIKTMKYHNLFLRQRLHSKTTTRLTSNGEKLFFKWYHITGIFFYLNTIDVYIFILIMDIHKESYILSI
jgi:hypothetical protein